MTYNDTMRHIIDLLFDEKGDERMTLEEIAMARQREKNREMVSNLMVTLLSIRIQCDTRCCVDCGFSSRQGCLFYLGFPYEWDDITLAKFRDGLERALEQTLTKGEAANENRTNPNGDLPVSE